MTWPVGPPDGAFQIGGGTSHWGQDYTEQGIKALFTIPVPTPLNSLDLLRQQLEKLPLDVLQMFKDLIPDPLENAFEAIGTAVDAIMDSLIDPIWKGIQAAVDFLTDLWNQLADLVQGIIITPLNGAMSVIADWWNSLGQALADGVESVGNVIDDLWSGLMGVLGIGKSSADVNNAATEISKRASDAIDLGEWNNALIGVRNNKPLMTGIDETEESTFSMAELFTGAATPPHINCTSSNVPIAFWRATEWAKKGFVSWFGEGYTDITAMYLDIYKFNYDTSELELMYTSDDVSGLASSAWQYIVYYLDEADRFDVHPGEVYGFALRVEGTGTHKLGAKSAPWLPAHPTVVPAKPAASRTGSGDVAFGSITYATDIPWFGVGIVSGDTPTLFFTPRMTNYSTAGSHTYTIPSWANFLDVSVLGGGGGGCGGNGGIGQHGEGGDAGSWVSETLERGVDFPSGATSLTLFVGDGGNGGSPGDPGAAGQASYRAAIASGKAQVTAAGGPGGDGWGLDTNYTYGDSPGNHTYGGRTFTGGGRASSLGASTGSAGKSPGGGGGGGAAGWFGIAWAGGKGGNGGAWVVARQS